MKKFMKCSNAWRFSHQLRNHMLKELKRAIQAHGGKYAWYSEEEEDFIEDVPIVMCNHRYAGPVDVKVCEVWLSDNDCINIKVETNEFGDEIEVDFDDIVPAHIQYIIECIPVTDNVNDVSIPSTDIPMYEEDYLNVLQELTSQAIGRLQDSCDISRNECFDLIRTWTLAFIYGHKDTDWREVDFYDEVDKFIDLKLKEI